MTYLPLDLTNLVLLVLVIGIPWIILILIIRGGLVTRAVYEAEVVESKMWRDYALRSQNMAGAAATTLEERSKDFQVLLRESMNQGLSISEVRKIAADLDVNWEELSGEGKSDKIRELVDYLVRRGKIGGLTNYLKLHRPDIWVGEAK